jgi:hypothetical protein
MLGGRSFRAVEFDPVTPCLQRVTKRKAHNE